MLEVSSISNFILYNNDLEYEVGNANLSLDLSDIPEGKYIFKVVNNVGTESATLTIYIDRTPPEIPIIDAGGLISNTWYNHDVTLTFLSTDNMTSDEDIIFEKSIGYERPSKPKFGEIVDKVTVFNESASPLKVLVRAIDKAGNKSEPTSESNGFIVKIDKRTPTELNVFAFIDDDINKPYTFGDVIEGKLRLMLFQDIKQDTSTSELIYEYQIENTDEWIILSKYSFLQLPNPVGPSHKGFMFDEEFNHNIKFRMRTSAGNIGPETDYYHININKTTIKLKDGAGNEILSEDHVNPEKLPLEKMFLEVNSNIGYDILINNEPSFHGEASGSFDLSDLVEGEYEIKAINSLGNVTKTLNVVVDKTPPEIPIIDGGEFIWYNQDITLTFTSIDNFTSSEELVYLYLVDYDGRIPIWSEPVSSPYTFTEKPLRATKIVAIDKAGNQSRENEGSFKVYIDKLVPGKPEPNAYIDKIPRIPYIFGTETDENIYIQYNANKIFDSNTSTGI